MKRFKMTRGTSIALTLLLSLCAAVPFTGAVAAILSPRATETSSAAEARIASTPADRKKADKSAKAQQNPVVVGGSLNGDPDRAVDAPRFGWRR